MTTVPAPIRDLSEAPGPVRAAAFAHGLGDRYVEYGMGMRAVTLGHAYEPVNYACKMLNVFGEDANDRELRELSFERRQL